MSNALILQGNAFAALKEQAAMFIKSGYAPKHIKTPEQAVVIAQLGVEIGLPVMQAFRQIFIGPDGKPSTDSHAKNFLIRKNCPGAIIEPRELTNEVCKIYAKRPGHQGMEFSFTIEDAKKAQLLANASWQKYPKNMLWARCISNIANMMFPDCISGVHTHEELGRHNVRTDDEGNIIDVIECYNPENNEHKKMLAAAFPDKTPDELRAISTQKIGKPLNELI